MKDKVLVPLNNRAFLDQLIEAGTDEFYMGFYDDSWTERFGDYSEINRMSGFGRKANPYSLDEALDIVREIKDKGRDVFITINAAAYNEKEQEGLRAYFRKIKEAGADGVIVPTPEVVKIAVEEGIAPVASTMCGIFNSDTVKFYSKLGMNRMILPRDLSLSEIEQIVTAEPDVQYEVFLMRNGCQFSDSHCLGFHRTKGSVCGMLNNCFQHILSNNNDFKTRHDIELNNFLYSKMLHKQSACGLCALYTFHKLGIGSYKVVGRAEFPQGIMTDVRAIKNTLEVAKASSSQEEFLANMQLPENAYGACKMGLSCYYPEVRF